MCDCNCSEVTINCNCPEPNPIEGAAMDSVTSTTFSGTPLDIYNSGTGIATTIYTNTSSANQAIIIDLNGYVTSTNPHILSHYFTLNGLIGESNVHAASQIKRYQLAPIKTDITHITTHFVITPGQSISFVITSSDSSARCVWLTAFIYKYQF